ncbi:MAG: serine hydrolase [Bacteroidota bacterium]
MKRWLISRVVVVALLFGTLHLFVGAIARSSVPKGAIKENTAGIVGEIGNSSKLHFASPESFGISSEKLKEIDSIVNASITKGAFPGCQIVVAYKGAIIYQKSFGTRSMTDTTKVLNTDLYDIASVSKIAGTTTAMMYLQSIGKLNLDKQLKDYLDDIKNPQFQTINIREMMAHQAGLPAWIPFYKNTLINNELNSSIYSKNKSEIFSVQVAEDIWIRKEYADSIYQQIEKSTLGAKKYLYSDLGYYFMKKIIEKQSGQTLDQLLTDKIYQPMGLQCIGYNPLKNHAKSIITPTENDKLFRKQTVQGFVHDPGAAMLGGVGGHAGLFSNATDLATLMQMILNKGSYGGVEYIKPEVVEEYTKAQFAGNRRGVGFDRPNASGGGTCHELASSKSFGHSGFTGTLVWLDPAYELNYVFLSNRVNPSAENWKIRDLNVRTEIQRVIYEAINRKNEPQK